MLDYLKRCETLSEEYKMESTVFDYNEIITQEHFGLKKYQDAVFRGELV